MMSPDDRYARFANKTSNFSENQINLNQFVIEDSIFKRPAKRENITKNEKDNAEHANQYKNLEEDYFSSMRAQDLAFGVKWAPISSDKVVK